jgi:hypothetical protein
MNGKFMRMGRVFLFLTIQKQFLDPTCQSKKVHYLGGLNIT